MAGADELMSKAAQRIEENPDLADFLGGADESRVLEASRILGIEFPPSYEKFLRLFGVGDFAGFEFFGIIMKNFLGEGIPNMIWINQNLRSELKLPSHLLVIAHTGYGPWFCIDTSVRDENRESPVCICSAQGQRMEIAYDNFAEFFAELVNRQ